MNKIELYTKEGCANCQMMKMWMNMKEIDFKEVDISKNDEKRKYLISNKRLSLPQVVVSGEFIDYNEFNDILEYI